MAIARNLQSRFNFTDRNPNSILTVSLTQLLTPTLNLTLRGRVWGTVYKILFSVVR